MKKRTILSITVLTLLHSSNSFGMLLTRKNPIGIKKTTSKISRIKYHQHIITESERQKFINDAHIANHFIQSFLMLNELTINNNNNKEIILLMKAQTSLGKEIINFNNKNIQTVNTMTNPSSADFIDVKFYYNLFSQLEKEIKLRE